MQMLSDIWITQVTTHRLYACKIMPSHVTGPTFVSANTGTYHVLCCIIKQSRLRLDVWCFGGTKEVG